MQPSFLLIVVALPNANVLSEPSAQLQQCLTTRQRYSSSPFYVNDRERIVTVFTSEWHSRRVATGTTTRSIFQCFSSILRDQMAVS